MTRTYTIEEVDEMRSAVTVLFKHDCNRAIGGSEAREAILKTYMQAGVEPAELEKEAARRREENEAAWQEQLDWVNTRTEIEINFARGKWPA